MKKLRGAIEDLWCLSRPYFTSEEKKSAWALLGVIGHLFKRYLYGTFVLGHSLPLFFFRLPQLGG